LARTGGPARPAPAPRHPGQGARIRGVAAFRQALAMGASQAEGRWPGAGGGARGSALLAP